MNFKDNLVKQAENDALVELGLAKPMSYLNKDISVSEKMASLYEDTYNTTLRRAESLVSRYNSLEKSAGIFEGAARYLSGYDEGRHAALAKDHFANMYNMGDDKKQTTAQTKVNQAYQDMSNRKNLMGKIETGLNYGVPALAAAPVVAMAGKNLYDSYKIRKQQDQEEAEKVAAWTAEENLANLAKHGKEPKDEASKQKLLEIYKGVEPNVNELQRRLPHQMIGAITGLGMTAAGLGTALAGAPKIGAPIAAASLIPTGYSLYHSMKSKPHRQAVMAAAQEAEQYMRPVDKAANLAEGLYDAATAAGMYGGLGHSMYRGFKHGQTTGKNPAIQAGIGAAKSLGVGFGGAVLGGIAGAPAGASDLGARLGMIAGMNAPAFDYIKATEKEKKKQEYEDMAKTASMIKEAMYNEFLDEARRDVFSAWESNYKKLLENSGNCF
jgi:hypothetical protein